MVPQMSTHWFSLCLLTYAAVHDWNRRRAAKATLNTEPAIEDLYCNTTMPRTSMEQDECARHYWRGRTKPGAPVEFIHMTKLK